MREIKFRAYIKTLKWIVPVSRINFDCETVEVDLGNGDYSEYDFDEVIIMQYTGLKDKNGVEIYEGDIARVGLSEFLFEVGFSQEYVQFKIFAVNGNISASMNRDLEYTVIGNIHNNPELMEVQNESE